MFDQFHRSRNKTGGVSIVVLKEHAVKLSSAIFVSSDSSGQNTILNTCIVQVYSLKQADLHPCREASASHTLLKDKPHKWDKAIEQNQLDGIYITGSHCQALCLMGSVQELPLLFCSANLASEATLK